MRLQISLYATSSTIETKGIQKMHRWQEGALLNLEHWRFCKEKKLKIVEHQFLHPVSILELFFLVFIRCWH